MLSVYDWSGPDGQPGGSAHAHLACTEGYVVLGGSGRLQTLGPDGFAETTLTPLTVAWFSPGVIHRLINSGGLRILVVMQNSGLPEAGDAVLTFPPEYLADPDRYREAANLAPRAQDRGDADPDHAYADTATAAQRRRDLAISGFLALRDRVAAEGIGVLDEFYAAAVELVREKVPRWRETWERGAAMAARRTGEQLDAIGEGGYDHLHEGRLHVITPPPEQRFGMCGRLTTY
jgi:hypothetical protein